MSKDKGTPKLLGLLGPDRRDYPPPGGPGMMLQYLDWNQAITAKHKLLVSDRRFGDGGLGSFSSQADFFPGSGTEAPRNSVDYSVADTPRSSHAKQEDIPLAFSAKYFTSSHAAQQQHQQEDIPVATFVPSSATKPNFAGTSSSASSTLPDLSSFFSGLEAPRNSVDYSLTDTPRASFARADDVPFGYEFPRSTSNAVPASSPRRFTGGDGGMSKKDVLLADFEARRSAPAPVFVPPRQSMSPAPASAGAGADFESRRKAPGVVARLMGLDALPDAAAAPGSSRIANNNRRDTAAAGVVADEDAGLPPTLLSPAARGARLRGGPGPSSGKESPQHWGGASSSEGPSTPQVQVSGSSSRRQPPPSVSPRSSVGETLPSPKKPQEIRILYPKQQLPVPDGSSPRRQQQLREAPAASPADAAQHHYSELLDRSEFEQLAAFREQHPQEKQLQEFKKQFEAKLQQPRDRFRVNQLDGSDKEFEDKKVLVRERLNEAKKTLGKQEVSDAKRLAAKHRVQESREFLEALEFLQSNRAFFLKFLQEPLSSLAKHMQQDDDDDASAPPPDSSPGPKRRSKSTDRRKSASRSPSRHHHQHHHQGEPPWRDRSASPGGASSPAAAAAAAARQLEEARKNREAKLLFRKQQGPKTPAELAIFTAARSRAASDGELGQPPSQRESPRTTDVESVGLTRIVVLKPTPGRGGSPHRSASSPTCSPRPYRFVHDRSGDTTSNNYNSNSNARHSVSNKDSSPKDLPPILLRSSGSEDGRPAFASFEDGPRTSSSYSGLEDEAGAGGGTGSKRAARSSKSSGAKDPRVIAKDIVRQAQENISKKLGGGSSKELSSNKAAAAAAAAASTTSVVRYRTSGKRVSVSRVATDSGDATTGSSDGDGSLTSLRLKPYQGSPGRSSTSSSPRLKSVETMAAGTNNNNTGRSRREGRKQQRQQPERIKVLQPAAALLVEEPQPKAAMSPLGRNAALVNVVGKAGPLLLPPSSSGSGSPKTRELSKNIVEGLIENALPDAGAHVLLADDKRPAAGSKPSGYKLDKVPKAADKLSSASSLAPPVKATAAAADEGGSKDASSSPPRASLTRSRSLPNSVVLGDWSSADVRKPASSSVCQSPVAACHQGVALNPATDSFKLPEKAAATAAVACQDRNARIEACVSDDGTTSTSPPPLDEGRLKASQQGEASSTLALDDPGDSGAHLHDAAAAAAQRGEPGDDGPACDQPREGHKDVDTGSLTPPPSSSHIPQPPPEGCELRVSAAAEPVATLLPSPEHVHLPGAAGPADCAHSRLTAAHEQSVSVGESKAPQEDQEMWSFSAESLDSADGASEASVEKGGQPSPVSILDSPFEQESPQSPPSDFTELKSDLQELRVRLQQLKLDGIQRPRDDLLGDHDPAVPLPDKLEQRLTCEPSDSSDCIPSSSAVTPSSPSSLLTGLDRHSFGISELPCPRGREGDLLYVRDLLVISGYVGGQGGALTKWFSPSRPLDVCLFDKLENWHKSPLAWRNNGASRNDDVLPPPEQQQRVDAMNRRVLFEIVNEILMKRLGPYVNQLPWTKTAKLALCSLPTDRQLVEETWREICTCHMPIEGPNYTLENMVERDLRRGRQWTAFQDEIEQVGEEVERHILSDLLEEAVRELLLLDRRTQGNVQQKV